MRLAPNDTARPESKLELVQIPVAADAKTTPAKAVAAVADTSTRTSTSPKQSANRAILKSGVLLGVSVTATSLGVGAANSVMYEWMTGATSAMVQSFVNTLNTMAGQQFIDRWNMLERRYIGYGVAAPRHAGGGAAMPAGLEDNFMQTFRRKAAMNNRVLGARNNYLMYSRLLQWHVSAVGSKLDRGEMMSAARLLAGAMVHDRALWFEIRPSEPQMLFFLRVMLSPYFMKLAPEKRQELATRVKAEILRIDSRAATNFDAAYAPLLNTLLAEPSAARRADAPADKANAAQPAVAKPLDAGMRTLLGRISEAGDNRKLSLDDINLIINAQGTNPNAKLDLTKALPSARAFRSASCRSSPTAAPSSKPAPVATSSLPSNGRLPKTHFVKRYKSVPKRALPARQPACTLQRARPRVLWSRALLWGFPPRRCSRSIPSSSRWSVCS